VCGCVKDGSSNQVESLIVVEEGAGNNPGLYLGRRPTQEEVALAVLVRPGPAILQTD
jgi:hypothetical protein